MIDRRSFSAALIAGAATALTSSRAISATSAAPTKARNVVLVHGLFADGSCWSEVIPRLQAAGLNVTSVQNPLTTLPEAVAAAERVLARQDGPTVLVGHSFSGMIVTEVTLRPAVCNRSITSDQLDPSANSPCTSTTLRAFGGAAFAAMPPVEISEAAAPATRAVEKVRLFIIVMSLPFFA